LRDEGLEVEEVPANMAKEEEVVGLVARHRERWGRMDVLINNAGVGIGGEIAEHETKKLDMQLNVNLRAVYLTLRESIPMLKEEMIQPEDIAEGVRFLLRTSPACIVPEVQFVRAEDLIRA